MSLSYIDWLGQTVIFRIDIGASQFPLRGQILGESSQTLFCRVAGALDVDVPKNVIVHVQPDRGEAYEQIHCKAGSERRELSQVTALGGDRPYTREGNKYPR